MSQFADANETSSGNPNDWWGGMDRSRYLYKEEKRPICIARSEIQEKAVNAKHTGLVFLHNNNSLKEKRADLYVSGKRRCTVMRFTGKRRKEYRNGKLVAKEKYFPDFKEYYRRRERDAKKERREFYWGCVCSIFDSMCSWCFWCFIATVFLALCCIILKIVGSNNCWLFSCICLLFIILCSGRFFLGKKYEMPMILFSLVVSLIGYLYSDSSTYWSTVFKAVYYIVIVSELFCLYIFVDIPEAHHVIEILIFIVPFLI